MGTAETQEVPLKSASASRIDNLSLLYKSSTVEGRVKGYCRTQFWIKRWLLTLRDKSLIHT